MDIYSTIITTVLSICIPVITSVLTILAKRWIEAKIQDIQDIRLRGLLAEATDVVLDSVNYVQQTYVSELKKIDKFTAEKHNEACLMALERATTLMPKEVEQVIAERYGNVDTFIETMIESYIARRKEEH